MIVEIEVILGRAIIVVEVIRVREAIFVEEITHPTRTGEIETIVEVEVEIGVEVTIGARTQQWQRKLRRVRTIMIRQSEKV